MNKELAQLRQEIDANEPSQDRECFGDSED